MPRLKLIHVNKGTPGCQLKIYMFIVSNLSGFHTTDIITYFIVSQLNELGFLCLMTSGFPTQK